MSDNGLEPELVGVLQTAAQELHDELDRITRLLKEPPGALRELEPLDNEDGTLLANKFRTFLSNAQNLLNDIDKQSVSDPKEAWDKYVELRSGIMPAFASELLSVIGGAFVQENKLDRIIPEDETGPSFSSIARDMVKVLNERSDRGWKSVLIVGEEERIGSNLAEVIRLRFAATNLWSLPVAAHEYGYLVMRSSLPVGLDDLRNQVSELADPRRHKDDGLRQILQRMAGQTMGDGSSAPDGRTLSEPQEPAFGWLFTPAEELWRKYRESSGERVDENELSGVRKTLIDHFYRLLGDAFATFFLGPAYVYALLNLRFMPDSLYRASSTLPAFAHRFAFALETLNWMDDWSQTGAMAEAHKAAYGERSNDVKNPFRKEVGGQPEGRLRQLWKTAVDSAGKNSDHLGKISEVYRPWLTGIWATFDREWSANGLRGTYSDWALAKRMQSISSSTDFAFESPDDLKRWTDRSLPVFALLNAAWRARYAEPERADTIVSNSLKLLARDPDLLRVKAADQAATQPGTPNGGAAATGQMQSVGGGRLSPAARRESIIPSAVPQADSARGATASGARTAAAQVVHRRLSVVAPEAVATKFAADVLRAIEQDRVLERDSGVMLYVVDDQELAENYQLALGKSPRVDASDNWAPR